MHSEMRKAERFKDREKNDKLTSNAKVPQYFRKVKSLNTLITSTPFLQLKIKVSILCTRT